MKKISFVLIILTFCLMSCVQNSAKKMIFTNSATEDVTFYLDDTEITLKSTETYSADYYKFKISFKDANQRLQCKCSSITDDEINYSIEAIEPVTYCIYNPLPVNVKVFEKNNGIGKPIQDSVEVLSGKEAKIEVFVKSPEFYATDENNNSIDTSLLTISKN